MNNRRTWHFGRCVVHLPTRELLRDGRPQVLPPKAFDLLVLLLRERDRVVPADELVNRLWPGVVLSKSVLPRTVMIVRRALGETAQSATLIRNMHGVGYRFVGQASESQAEPPAPAVVRRHPGGSNRIGVLPCLNDSGDPALDWLRMGLPVLVSDALLADARLQVLPPELLASALDESGASMTTDARLRMAQAGHGLDCVVQAVLKLQGGTPMLEFQVHARASATGAGSLRDARPVALGLRLAQALQSMLFPGDEATLPAVPRDDFALQAHARALDLWCRGDLAAAQELLAVVCRLEPDNHRAALCRIRTLAAMGDRHAVALAEAHLAQARALDDPRLEAQTHAALDAPGMCTDPQWQDIAQRHRSAALDLLDGVKPAHWTLQLRSAQALDRQAGHPPAEARRLHREAIAEAHALRSAAAEAPLQFSLAMLELAQGDLPRARHGLESAIAAQRPLYRPEQLAASLAMLGWAHASMGLFTRAGTQCSEALSQLHAGRHAPPRAAAVLTALARVLHEAGTRDQWRRLLTCMAGLRGSLPSHQLEGPVLAAQGCQALRDGDVDHARHRLHDACAAAPPDEPLFLHTWLPLRQRLELARGELDGAEALQHAIDALPGAGSDRALAAVRLRLEAARHLAHGDATQALALLRRAMAAAPSGWETARARLDAAWLLAEQGQTEAAQGLLGGAGAWCDEHPDGLTVSARVLLAQGRAGDAAMQLRRAQAMLADRVAPWQAALRQHAERAAAGLPAAPIPALPCLLGDAWLSGQTLAADRMADALRW